MLHENAKWIRTAAEPMQEEYTFFRGTFTYRGGSAIFSIAAETDYILYINGAMASFGQFPGYPFEKYYDEAEVSHLCRTGENSYLITVRYEGVNSATHIDDGAGVIFSLCADDELLCCSTKDTVCGYDGRYIAHKPRHITGQLGFTSGMIGTDGDPFTYSTATEVEMCRDLLPRPVKKAILQEPVEAVPIAAGSTVYDLGREEAGYLRLRVRARRDTEFSIAYGEHIADGQVRYRIGHRNFTLDFKAEAGEREFFQLFLRLSARYLQLLNGEDVEIIKMELVPLLYPLTEKPLPATVAGEALTETDALIYKTCVRTLRLCMNAHYEDCPWREQALYVMDSRNQMLCGYRAFEETEFQRGSLMLISKGVREDGLLELTYPAVNTPAIPFFSLMYPVAVKEYIDNTGDLSILPSVMPALVGIMTRLASLIDENGLIPELPEPYWNFFEWSEGSLGERGDSPYHLILNTAFIYSCDHFLPLCRMSGVDFKVDTESLRLAVMREFFIPESGLFTLRPHGDKVSQLGCAMALLAGLGDSRTAAAIKEDCSLIPATLSMLTFVYDALLQRDRDNYRYILGDIREKYGYMLSLGATSFWETIEGESAFDNAGSLCHGWSAMPVYYYDLFKDMTPSVGDVV